MLTYLPDGVALRLTWMYDTPAGGSEGNQGLLKRLMDALKEQQPVEFPVHDYRGITYVWEVVRHMEEAMELPGGVYNFGSQNGYSTYHTARLFLRELTGSESSPILRANEDRFASCPRNLTMNTDKIKSKGIHFSTTAEGIRLCCEEMAGAASSRLLCPSGSGAVGICAAH